MASVSSTITLVDQMSGALAGIEANINSMKNTLQSVAGEQTSIDNFKWDTFIKNAEKAGEKMAKIGQKMSLALTAPLLMLGKEMYGDAVEYESAFAGVKKTTEATAEEYDALYSDLLHISETNPTGFTEAAGIMEMAGQLGVAKEELTGFTESYIKLQETTNILGEDGAEDLARFLNVTEKTSNNIERIGGVIVGLGNNNATTEREILSMATRIGATGDLAGFSAKEILGLSAALSSVGINAEAGGSAAGKLMKKMQLAAEVGGSAADRIKDVDLSWTDDNGVKHERYLSDFVTNGLEMVNYLDTLKSADKVDIASQLGITTETLQNMADSWLLFDQFSEVMGITGEEFLSGWKEAPAMSMLKFFQGLGNLGQEGGESVLAKLAEMDITEIRLSNLVAAMAGNSDLLQAALEEAYRQYDMNPENNAMNEEVAKRYETTESQNKMLGNKLNNTMADFGDNLVRALEPALKMVNDILDAFNSLSESDQSAILTSLAVIAGLGPALMIAGNAIKVIAAAMKLISGSGKGAADAVQQVVNAANTPTTPAAGAETAAEAGLSAGSKLIGGLTLAGVAALFGEGIKYRNEHGELGSVDAIQRATENNLTLRDAFIEWVDANNALNEAALSFEPISDEKANALVERQQKAIENFFGTEGAGVLQDLYNDWRDVNGLSLDDWVLPEDLSSWFQTPEIETPEVTVPEPVIQLPEVAAPEAESGGMIVGMGFGFGFNQGVEAQADTINTAAQTLSNGAVNSAVSTINNGAVSDASASMSSEAVSSAEGILSAGAGSGIGRNFMAGLAGGIRAGGGAAVAAAAGVAASVKAAVSSILQIHSPSKVAYWQGEMTMLGFANGISDGEDNIMKTVRGIYTNVRDAWNSSAWEDIGVFTDLENQKFLDPDNDELKLNDSDIKKVRQLAEREVINTFTTAEIKIEMTNNNNINSEMDIDGIVDRLEEKVSERLEMCAEGVYA